MCPGFSVHNGGLASIQGGSLCDEILVIWKEIERTDAVNFGGGLVIFGNFGEFHSGIEADYAHAKPQMTAPLPARFVWLASFRGGAFMGGGGSGGPQRDMIG